LQTNSRIRTAVRAAGAALRRGARQDHAAERLIRTIVVSVERLPKLLECDRQSLFNAAMSAAVLGLEVDGVTGQAYLIPFKGKAQLVIGYKGYNTLAARSGITITGAVVREGDEFDYELGSAAFVRHRPKLGRTRIAASSRRGRARSRSTGRPSDGHGHRRTDGGQGKSPGAARSDSPWNDPKIGFPAMCEKTVKRRLARSLPLNVMQLAARMDEAVDEQGARRGSTVSRFRPRYRALTDDEKALHDEIKNKAAELEALFGKVKPGRYNALAITSLEQSVMWVVKELTEPSSS
jgi:recombination protein RecT